MNWQRVHLVLNKMDLVNGDHDEEWVKNYSPRGVHRASAKTGQGVTELHRALEVELTAGLQGDWDAESLWVTNERHAHELRQAADALSRACGVLESGEPLELGAADLHRALDHLAAITGDRAGQDLLDLIFRRFCIGK